MEKQYTRTGRLKKTLYKCTVPATDVVFTRLTYRTYTHVVVFHGPHGVRALAWCGTYPLALQALKTQELYARKAWSREPLDGGQFFIVAVDQESA